MSESYDTQLDTFDAYIKSDVVAHNSKLLNAVRYFTNEQKHLAEQYNQKLNDTSCSIPLRNQTLARLSVCGEILSKLDELEEWYLQVLSDKMTPKLKKQFDKASEIFTALSETDALLEELTDDVLDEGMEENNDICKECYCSKNECECEGDNI